MNMSIHHLTGILQIFLTFGLLISFTNVGTSPLSLNHHQMNSMKLYLNWHIRTLMFFYKNYFTAHRPFDKRNLPKLFSRSKMLLPLQFMGLFNNHAQKIHELMHKFLKKQEIPKEAFEEGAKFYLSHLAPEPPFTWFKHRHMTPSERAMVRGILDEGQYWMNEMILWERVSKIVQGNGTFQPEAEQAAFGQFCRGLDPQAIHELAQKIRRSGDRKNIRRMNKAIKAGGKAANVLLQLLVVESAMAGAKEKIRRKKHLMATQHSPVMDPNMLNHGETMSEKEDGPNIYDKVETNPYMDAPNLKRDTIRRKIAVKSKLDGPTDEMASNNFGNMNGASSSSTSIVEDSVDEQNRADQIFPQHAMEDPQIPPYDDKFKNEQMSRAEYNIYGVSEAVEVIKQLFLNENPEKNIKFLKILKTKRGETKDKKPKKSMAMAKKWLGSMNMINGKGKEKQQKPEESEVSNVLTIYEDKQNDLDKLFDELLKIVEYWKLLIAEFGTLPVKVTEQFGQNAGGMEEDESSLKERYFGRESEEVKRQLEALGADAEEVFPVQKLIDHIIIAMKMKFSNKEIDKADARRLLLIVHWDKWGAMIKNGKEKFGTKFNQIVKFIEDYGTEAAQFLNEANEKAKSAS